MQGHIFIINSDKTLVFNQSEHVQGPIYIIKTGNDLQVKHKPMLGIGKLPIWMAVKLLCLNQHKAL